MIHHQIISPQPLATKIIHRKCRITSNKFDKNCANPCGAKLVVKFTTTLIIIIIYAKFIIVIFIRITIISFITIISAVWKPSARESGAPESCGRPSSCSTARRALGSSRRARQLRARSRSSRASQAVWPAGVGARGLAAGGGGSEGDCVVLGAAGGHWGDPEKNSAVPAHPPKKPARNFAILFCKNGWTSGGCHHRPSTQNFKNVLFRFPIFDPFEPQSSP